METTTLSFKQKVLSYGWCLLGKPANSLPMILSIYTFSFLLVITGINVLVYLFHKDESTVIQLGGLVSKTQHYLSNPSQYNLIFLGDSRTYCAIQPDLVDAAMGTRSYNLARFSHGFPTQYAQVMDILHAIPQGTMVVWSVGHQNFNEPDDIRRTYPIHLGQVPDYLHMGFRISELVDNVTYFNPFTHFFARRGEFRKSIMKAWKEVFLTWDQGQGMASDPTFDERGLAPEEQQKLREEMGYLIGQYQNAQSYAVRVLEERGMITSVVLYKRQGAYHRIELNKEFFRKKQEEALTALGGALTGRDLTQAIDAVGGEAKYLRLFEQILRAFQQRGIQLVVNEFQEAPFTYRSPMYRKAWSDFMKKQIKPLVERYGFEYTSVNFDALEDEHYFDSRHLNNHGIQAFTPMLVERLNKRRL